MKHVYWVLDGMLAGRCGPALVPWAPRKLIKSGVQGIVSLDAEGVDALAIQEAGLMHLPLYQPMVLLTDDDLRRQFLTCVPDVLRFMDEVTRKRGAMLVHCYHGCDRTGAVLACCLMARGCLSAEEAIDRVRSVQPQAMIAPGYLESVLLFEKIQQELLPP